MNLVLIMQESFHEEITLARNVMFPKCLLNKNYTTLQIRSYSFRRINGRWRFFPSGDLLYIRPDFVYKRKFIFRRVRNWLIYCIFSSHKKNSSSLTCFSEHINSIFNFRLYQTILSFIFVKIEVLNQRVEQTLRRKTKLIFPALGTRFSFQAFARSPRCKSGRVLDLKLPNDCDGYENVTKKVNSRYFKLYGAYSTSLNSSNVGKFFWS